MINSLMDKIGKPGGVSAPCPALTETVGLAPCPAFAMTTSRARIRSRGFVFAAPTQKWGKPLMAGIQGVGTRVSKCFLCEDQFDVSAERTLFCSEVCKTRYNSLHQTKCFYCGDIATERDHVVPHALSGRNRRIWRLDWVLSCGECNSFMNANAPYSMTERVRIVIAKVTRRYKLDRPDPDWDEHDREGMSKVMLAKINADAEKRRMAQARITMLKARLSDLIEMELSLIDKQAEDEDAA